MTLQAMAVKAVFKQDLSACNEVQQNLAFWLSKAPEERISAVEFLRKQIHGNLPRLQRTFQIIQRP